MSWPARTCWGQGELSSGNPSARTIWSARYAKSWTGDGTRDGAPLCRLRGVRAHPSRAATLRLLGSVYLEFYNQVSVAWLRLAVYRSACAPFMAMGRGAEGVPNRVNGYIGRMALAGQPLGGGIDGNTFAILPSARDLPA